MFKKLSELTVWNWIQVGITLGGIIYGYGALQTRVSALEAQNPIQIGQDVAVLKSDVKEIKADVREIKNRLLQRP